MELPDLVALRDLHDGGVEVVRPRQAGHDPAVLATHAVEHAVVVVDAAAFHPVEDVVGVGVSRRGHHVDGHRRAATGPARDEDRVRGREPLLDAFEELRVQRPGESALLLVPDVGHEGERDQRGHGCVSGEDPLLGSADIEDLHSLGVRLPHVVGFLRGDVELQLRLPLLHDRAAVVCRRRHDLLFQRVSGSILGGTSWVAIGPRSAVSCSDAAATSYEVPSAVDNIAICGRSPRWRSLCCSSAVGSRRAHARPRGRGPRSRPPGFRGRRRRPRSRSRCRASSGSCRVA